jgi:CheY-like chemotaxis protein
MLEFVAEGLTQGERVIVMATREHAAQLEARLGQRGIDVRGLSRTSLVLIDADLAARHVAPDGRFDDEALRALLAPHLADGTRRRIYGEIVSVLAAGGCLEAACAFEAAGQQLVDGDTAVFCGYILANLEGGRNGSALPRIEGLHDHAFVEPPPEADAAAGSLESGALVLLVDDFDDAREMYEEYLRFSGIRVVTAASGEEAIRVANIRLPDLILMDIRMPGMTGVEAMHTLRREGRRRDVPIIALTAHALDTERTAMLSEGFDAVLTKPCLPDQLVAAVRDGLRAPAP